MSSIANSSSFDVAIVGTGAVALTAALSFKEKRVVLIDSQPQKSHKIQRFFALNKNSLDFLQTIGVFPTVFPVNAFHLFSPKHDLLLEHNPLCSIVSEGHLLAKLQNTFQKEALVKLDCQHVDWQETNHTNVLLKVDNDYLSAKLLIVADGALSSLAEQLKVFSDRTSYNQQALVATLTAPALNESTAYQWFAKKETIAFLPLGHHQYTLIWSANHPLTHPTAKHLCQLLKEKTHCELEIDPDSITLFPLYSQQRSLPAITRTAFVGDALRVVHPLAGQGLNLGINNCRHLALCTKNRLDIGSAKALCAYARAANDKGKLIEWITSSLYQSDRFCDRALMMGKNQWLNQFAIHFANW